VQDLLRRQLTDFNQILPERAVNFLTIEFILLRPAVDLFVG
jgi:hypothetical protein